jgi:CrcB protein
MTTCLNLVMVAIGGAAGSLARYGITIGSAALPWGSTMLGTTISNVLGCAAIGAFSEYVIVSEHLPEHSQLAIRVGLLGGLTTFSTFAYESVALAETGRWGMSGFYVLANLFLGWCALMIATTMVRGWMA